MHLQGQLQAATSRIGKADTEFLKRRRSREEGEPHSQDEDAEAEERREGLRPVPLFHRPDGPLGRRGRQAVRHVPQQAPRVALRRRIRAEIEGEFIYTTDRL